MTAYEEAFRDLILSKLKEQASTPGTETYKIVRENPGRYSDGNEVFNKPIREKLNRALGCYGSAEEVLWYCYTYMQMHYDAFLRVIELDVTEGQEAGTSIFPSKIFNTNGNLLVIDVGCGPMTSGVAMAQWYIENTGQPLSMSYVGIDDSQHCLDMAEKFANRRDLFKMMHPADFIKSFADCDFTKMKEKVTNEGTIVFNFSYLFGQESCEHTDQKEIVKFIGDVVSNCHAKNNFLIYTNSTWGDLNGKYAAFRQMFERKWKHEPLLGTYNKRTIRNLQGRINDNWGPEHFKHLIVEIRPTDKDGNLSW